MLLPKKLKLNLHPDEQTGETIELPCVVMIEQTSAGDLKTIRNGSKRLVASLEDALHTGKIIQRCSFENEEYLGKAKKMPTNSFQSDRWSVKTIICRIMDIQKNVTA